MGSPIHLEEVLQPNVAQLAGGAWSIPAHSHSCAFPRYPLLRYPVLRELLEYLLLEGEWNASSTRIL
jgi:hypothetical protein